jgi:glc operon protein GlcG
MKKEHQEIISQLIAEIEKLIPVYMQNEEDRSKANGNVALCIIDNEGFVMGKVFGNDKIRGREAFRVAWTKASQVSITGMRTGEFEKRVFNNEIDEATHGIRKPDYIGWLGGQPVTLKDGTIFSVGFSGFRGVTDLEIVTKALYILEQKKR